MKDRSAPADLAALLVDLLGVPGRLDRIEQQQARILAAVEALAGGAAVGPVDLTAAAPALGKSVATLRRLAKAGALPGAQKIGRTWKVDLGALRAAGSVDRIGELAAEARA